MNRETKRMMQRQGQLGRDGETQTQKPAPQSLQRRSPDAPKRGIREYFKNVRAELRRVNWPSRADVINYASVVLISLVILISLIFVLNTAFSKAVFFLFK